MSIKDSFLDSYQLQMKEFPKLQDLKSFACENTTCKALLVVPKLSLVCGMQSTCVIALLACRTGDINL